MLDTESVAKAVQGAADWAKETGKALGGVIPAAGVSTPATVSVLENYEWFGMWDVRLRWSRFWTAMVKPST